MAIYTYCRVPMGLQVEEGDSLETQQRQVQGYAQMHGFVIAAHFVESGVSGLVPLGERTEGQRLLAVLKSGDAVITPKLHRMFRSARNALDTMTALQDQGVALHIIDLGGDFTANGSARLVSTTLAAVAGPGRRRAEKRNVKTEPSRARERAVEVKRGHRDGENFGFKHLENGTVVPVWAEQAAIRELRQLRAEGVPFPTLLGFMEARGFLMSPKCVRDILARFPIKESVAEPSAVPSRKRRAYGRH